jgi:hypothetical protein
VSARAACERSRERPTLLCVSLYVHIAHTWCPE